MKKLLVLISAMALSFMSCEKDVNPVSTESKFIGTWEAQSWEASVEEGLLNPEDTTIRIVEEVLLDSGSYDSTKLVLDFTSDSVFFYSEFYHDDPFQDGVLDTATWVRAWTYSDDTLYFEFTNEEYSVLREVHVKTLSNTFLVYSEKYYLSINNFNDTYTTRYWDVESTIYFKKINSEDSGCCAGGRLIKGDKVSFFQGLEKRRNGKRLR